MRRAGLGRRAFPLLLGLVLPSGGALRAQVQARGALDVTATVLPAPPQVWVTTRAGERPRTDRGVERVTTPHTGWWVDPQALAAGNLRDLRIWLERPGVAAAGGAWRPEILLEWAADSTALGPTAPGKRLVVTVWYP